MNNLCNTHHHAEGTPVLIDIFLHWCWLCHQSVHMAEREEFAYWLSPRFKQKNRQIPNSQLCVQTDNEARSTYNFPALYHNLH